MSSQGHHLILGQRTDFLSGETIADTHDERYRQRLARMLVEAKGFAVDEITAQKPLLAKAGSNKAIIKLDFYLTVDRRIRMIIKYGPGSLVTRQRPALAISRLLASYQIPLVVVTNGEDMDLLDGKNGKVLASGWEAMPTRAGLLEATQKAPFNGITPWQAAMEARILYAYEVDGSCPCDDTICRL